MPIRPSVFRSHQAPSRRQVDRDRRSARERGYTTEWDRASKAHLSANPLCLGCHAVGRVTAARVTDHVVPHRGDAALLWAKDNRQSACQAHHDRVKKRLEAMFFAGRIDAAELRLDSETAKSLTRELLG